ncbi:putative E3 ubiquitin-protein ligase listerin [Apostichopus japonicus]|uniref:E3 ubiquitin-protein ligase listerin n=1 Tax=Stichopus japonicus TaxID=307972 RepID=A0A2G8KJ47_STIJA|nr:putative E3 ubiquitin-protein ligase listerin [Apostichopus japonicus]
MSGKKQRTKGNVKPSSSGRTAKLLEKDGGGAVSFVGFGALSGDLGYIPSMRAGEDFDRDLDDDFRITMRKMTKKDSVTKMKAIQDFGEFCKSKEEQEVLGALPHFPRLYNRLVMDTDKRVREATQHALQHLVVRSGRNLAPHLKLLLGSWLLGQCDGYPPCALAAKMAFKRAFPSDEKRQGAAGFCIKEVLAFIEANLLVETVESLTDSKTLSPAERTEHYNDIVASTILSLKLLIDLSPQKSLETANQQLADILKQDKFWKFGKHTSPHIRSGFFAMLKGLCDRFPTVTEKYLSKMAPLVLCSLDETDSRVVSNLWQTVLILISKYPVCWSHVNLEKAVLPKIWYLLKQAGKGSAYIVFPNLLPLLSHLPSKVMEDKLKFYRNFFEKLKQGLFDCPIDGSSGEEAAILKAYVECLHYAASTSVKEEIDLSFLNYILLEELLPSAENTLRDKHKQAGSQVMFSQMSSFLSYLSKISLKQVGVEETLKQFWQKFSDTCLGILEEEPPQSSHMRNLAACITDLNCPGESDKLYRRLVRTKSAGGRTRVTFNPKVSFNQLEEPKSNEESQLENKDDMKPDESSSKKQERLDALDNDVHFSEFVEKLLAHSWTRSKNKVHHFSFVNDLQFGLQSSSTFYSLLVSANDGSEFERRGRELGMVDRVVDMSDSKDAKDGKKKVLNILVSRILDSNRMEDKNDEMFDTLVDMILQIITQCPRLEQSALLDDALSHLQNLHKVATFLKKVKEFEDQSLKKQWYSSSNFAERLVHLTSDLCKESMSGSAMVTPDYWNLVGMAFETDSDDKPYLDDMFTEQILGVIYQTLQAAHQEPHSDEAKIRTVNLICDVAASFFSSVKTCVHMPAAEDLLLALFQLSSRKDFQCSYSLRRKLDKAWTSGVEGLVTTTGGFLKTSGFFDKVSKWIKSYLFQKKGQLGSSDDKEEELLPVSRHGEDGHLPSSEEEGSHLASNAVLETFIKMVLSTEAELQEYASLLNDQFYFTTLLLKGSMTFDPSHLFPTDLHNTSCYITHALFVGELLKNLSQDKVTFNVLSLPSRLCIQWTLDISLALVWCEVSLGCEEEKKIRYPVDQLNQRGPQISLQSISELISALSRAVKLLTCDDWKQLLVIAKDRTKENGLAEFLSFRNLLRDSPSSTNLSGADVITMCGGFDRLATLSSLQELQMLECILSFVPDPQVLLQCHTAVLMTTDPLNTSLLTEAFFSLSAISSCIPFISSEEEEETGEVFGTILTYLIQLRDTPEDTETLYLFECSLDEASSTSILINLKVMQLIRNIVNLSPSSLKAEHWDFVMCSIVSWCLTCTESLLLERTELHVSFNTAAFNLLATVASLMSKVKSTDSACKDVPPDLTTEWVEFFAGGIFDALLPSYVHFVEHQKETLPTSELILLRSFSSAISHAPVEQVKGHSLPARLIPDFPSFIPEEMQTLLNTLSDLLELKDRGVVIAAFKILQRVMADFAQFYEKGSKKTSDSVSLEDEEVVIPPPKPLLDIIIQSESILEESVGDVLVGEYVPVNETSDIYHICLQYLLSWDLVLCLFESTKTEVRAEFAAYLKKTNSLSTLLKTLFKLMPTNPAIQTTSSPSKKQGKGPSTLFSETLDLKVQALHANPKDIQHLATSVYQHALQVMPALIRQWWSNQDRRIANLVERYTTLYVSPLLSSVELKGVNASTQTFDNMSVVARVITREVIATYALQDLSIELVILLPTNYPLGIITVESGKKIGVSAAQWRNWMLQLTTYLTKQNGTIMDGLALWRQNVDKRFEGIEECTICYSVIHGANCSLPKIGCRTCKKKFHSACLYKWFKSSNQSTCPLCRSPF